MEEEIVENESGADFINQVTNLIEQNLAIEQFGVSELADALHMSRSNLLRKVKRDTKLSVSQLINQVRLKRAMELLRKSSLNVSEVSHQVGFGSPSYFIKCFREYYGYPPGEVGKRGDTEPLPIKKPSNKLRWVLGVAAMVLLVVSIVYVINRKPTETVREKSIAVLPFKNESNDSSNLYLINGLMESTLNNLQKIKDLRVVSRTSSEKYRHSSQSIPEMAEELNVNYVVEGSGQKIGDRIVLTIQLIDAKTDKHLWSNQYRRETKDIFSLQQEIAQRIADEIQAIITPVEKTRINQKPTNNLVAYDWYLKAKNIPQEGRENLLNAIALYQKAIEADPQFALAYAEIAINYHYLDLFQADKQYQRELSEYADKALLYEPTRGECLAAKALDYLSKKEYQNAEPFLEKALEYNPNSAWVIGFLSDFYGLYAPNTGKYLKYALKGLQLNNISVQDSAMASYTYLRLSNALIQTGFVDEALTYINKSLAYNPKNPFANYVRAFILFAKTNDAAQTRNLLIEEYKKDSTRFDILQDIGKVSYYMRDYAGAYQYYKQFLAIREGGKMDVYQYENLIIGYVMAKANQPAKADELVESYKAFWDRDKSIYKNLALSGYYNYKGNIAKAIEHIQLFAKEDNVQYWVILFFEADPMSDNLNDRPEFKEAFKEVKKRFWATHKQLNDLLTQEGLLSTKP